MKQVMPWMIAAVFIVFAIVNFDDPDWFIWVPTYIAIGLLPLLPTGIINNSHLKIVAIVVLILGIIVALGFLNTIMPRQVDNRMVNMWEYQREGVGLVLGAIWLWFGRKLK